MNSNNNDELADKYRNWRVRLYGGRGLDYHLWLKPPEDIFRHHHDDRCKCDVRAAAAHIPATLDPDCYDVVENMTCTVDFREAHRIVEGGFADAERDFDARTSVVNCGGGGGGDGFEVEAESSPYRDVKGGHPAGKSRLVRFTVQGDNVQTRGPKWGNIGFTTQ